MQPLQECEWPRGLVPNLRTRPTLSLGAHGVGRKVIILLLFKSMAETPCKRAKILKTQTETY